MCRRPISKGAPHAVAAALAAASYAFVAAAEAGTPVPVGGEQQVNVYTTSFQAEPVVAPLPDGGVLVAWESDGSSGTDTSSRSVQVRRYGTDGSPTADPFQLNSYTTNLQENVGAAVFGADDVVVVWRSSGSLGGDTSGSSIQARLLDGTGAPRASEFQVNTYTTGGQDEPEVAPNGAGGFVVVWESPGSSGADQDSNGILGQVFDSMGGSVGAEIQVNSYTTGFQENPAVASLGPLGFVVAWESFGSSGPDVDDSIQAQRFAPDGTALAGQFQVNTVTPYNQRYPAVSEIGGDGAFAIAWHGGPGIRGGGDGDEQGIAVRLFDALGSPVTGELPVNDLTAGSQRRPWVSRDGTGGFVVTWQSDGRDGDATGIAARRLSAVGALLGAEIQVNTYTTSAQAKPRIARGAGGAVVVWESFGSGGDDIDGSSIQARVLRSGLPFVDAFETGDVCGWSSSVAAPACF